MAASPPSRRRRRRRRRWDARAVFFAPPFLAPLFLASLFLASDAATVIYDLYPLPKFEVRLIAPALDSVYPNEEDLDSLPNDLEKVTKSYLIERISSALKREEGDGAAAFDVEDFHGLDLDAKATWTDEGDGSASIRGAKASEPIKILATFTGSASFVEDPARPKRPVEHDPHRTAMRRWIEDAFGDEYKLLYLTELQKSRDNEMLQSIVDIDVDVLPDDEDGIVKERSGGQPGPDGASDGAQPSGTTSDPTSSSGLSTGGFLVGFITGFLLLIFMGGFYVYFSNQYRERRKERELQMMGLSDGNDTDRSSSDGSAAEDDEEEEEEQEGGSETVTKSTECAKEEDAPEDEVDDIEKGDVDEAKRRGGRLSSTRCQISEESSQKSQKGSEGKSDADDATPLMPTTTKLRMMDIIASCSQLDLHDRPTEHRDCRNGDDGGDNDVEIEMDRLYDRTNAERDVVPVPAIRQDFGGGSSSSRRSPSPGMTRRRGGGDESEEGSSEASRVVTRRYVQPASPFDVLYGAAFLHSDQEAIEVTLSSSQRKKRRSRRRRRVGGGSPIVQRSGSPIIRSSPSVYDRKKKKLPKKADVATMMRRPAKMMEPMSSIVEEDAEVCAEVAATEAMEALEVEPSLSAYISSSRRSLLRRSPSPFAGLERSPSPFPDRKRSPSPFPGRKRSPSPFVAHGNGSPSPMANGRSSPSPFTMRRSPSPFAGSNGKRSPSPFAADVSDRRSPSPFPFAADKRSPSPFRAIKDWMAKNSSVDRLAGYDNLTDDEVTLVNFSELPMNDDGDGALQADAMETEEPVVYRDFLSHDGTPCLMYTPYNERHIEKAVDDARVSSSLKVRDAVEQNRSLSPITNGRTSPSPFAAIKDWKANSTAFQLAPKANRYEGLTDDDEVLAKVSELPTNDDGGGAAQEEDATASTEREAVYQDFPSHDGRRCLMHTPNDERDLEKAVNGEEDAAAADIAENSASSKARDEAERACNVATAAAAAETAGIIYKNIVSQGGSATAASSESIDVPCDERRGLQGAATSRNEGSVPTASQTSSAAAGNDMFVAKLERLMLARSRQYWGDRASSASRSPPPDRTQCAGETNAEKGNAALAASSHGGEYDNGPSSFLLPTGEGEDEHVDLLGPWDGPEGKWDCDAEGIAVSSASCHRRHERMASGEGSDSGFGSDGGVDRGGSVGSIEFAVLR